MSRRTFLKKAIHIMGALTLSENTLSSPNPNPAYTSFMPDESGPHKRTWMAFVANSHIWSRQQIPDVKRNLALIATTIAKYEPVSMLVSPGDQAQARQLLGDKDAHAFPIELIEFRVDDLWLRDTGPTFAINNDGKKVAIDFNFNGWGNKQEHSLDRQVAGFIAQQSGAVLKKTTLVLEGGCFEVDGHGTAILTKSCVINDNRNPHLSQGQIERELKSLLGLRKIIWLDGIKEKDITDGHTDFYARFTKPGQVMVSRDNYRGSHDYDVTRENIRTLQNSTDADGNKLDLTIIDTPDTINTRYGTADFAAGYIGYYLCNNAVIMQKFGDRQADAKARQAVANAFPDRSIEQIAIDGIASGGGSVHCATQQEIQARKG